MPFSERVALVTGSSRGIGRTIALHFARGGANVVVNYRGGGASERRAEELCAAIAALGRRAIAVQADIAEARAVRDMMARTGEELGRLDILVLNAARAPFKPYERLLERDLRELVGTNFLGNVFCIRESLPLLARSSGSIVFISSLGSRLATPSYPLGSMKAAMEAVVRDCAESLRGKGVRVNAVCGGIVRTDSYKTLRQVWEGLERLPAEMLVTADEIAEVVTFLCSPAAAGICGQTIVVDRGLGNRAFTWAPAPPVGDRA
jgi:enoyl-[acyl-carrier protein] reductase III